MRSTVAWLVTVQNPSSASKSRFLFICSMIRFNASSHFSRSNLDRHRKTHGELLEWPCGKCEETFPSYTDLCKHHFVLHEEGLFECSVDDCGFKSATTRVRVLTHQNIHPFQKHSCSVPGCGRSYALKRDLERHLRRHLNKMTARCTWPGCTFISTWDSSVIRHIRRFHFQSKGKSPNPNEGNPKEYIEMM